MTESLDIQIARAIASRCGERVWEIHLADAMDALRVIREAGLQVVPLEPTDAMLDAAIDADEARDPDADIDDQVTAIWTAMLAAAPKHR